MQKSSEGQGSLLRDRVQREVIYRILCIQYLVEMIRHPFAKAFNHFYNFDIVVLWIIECIDILPQNHFTIRERNELYR
jgi:hypothetical protein